MLVRIPYISNNFPTRPKFQNRIHSAKTSLRDICLIILLFLIRSTTCKMSTNQQDIDAAYIERLSVIDLIKLVNKQMPMSVPDTDEEIMQKSFICGYVLLYCASEEDLRKQGMSFGGRLLLINFKSRVLRNEKRQQTFLSLHFLLSHYISSVLILFSRHERACRYQRTIYIYIRNKETSGS